MLSIEQKNFQSKIHLENSHGSVLETPINSEVNELIINHKYCQARVSLKGGQVLSWIPDNQEEVFWLSEKSPFSSTTAIRGGIPICWPWFGNLKGAPSHGFARNSQWQIDAIEITQEYVKITLRLDHINGSLHWPFQYSCKQTLEFSTVFKQQLHIVNKDVVEFSFSNALHSYFKVSSPLNVLIPELNKVTYDNKLNQMKGCKPQNILHCQGPVDNIFHHTSCVTLFDKGKRRAIEIKKSNSSQWVLWNPGEKTATKMIDIHQGGEHEFVCLEAANTNSIILAPEECITLSQEIQVYKL